MDEQDERARLRAFHTLLDGSKDAREVRVEMTALRKLCARGIPEYPRYLRPLAYSLLLGTLPPDKRAWRRSARAKRAEYYALVKALMDELESLPPPSDPQSSTDHLLLRISKDLNNFLPRYPFLRSRSSRPTSPITLVSPKLLDSSSFPSPNTQPDTHADVILRLLYIFTRTSPMPYSPNILDVLVPLYLVFAEADFDPAIAASARAEGKRAEEDTFWAFTALAAELGDVISPPAELGPKDVAWALERLGRRVRWADPLYAMWLSARNLDPAQPLYAYQWISLLLTRETGPVLPALWDYILAEPPATADSHPKLDMLIDVCAAMILLAKPFLLRAPDRARHGKASMWDNTADDGEGDDVEAAFARGLQLLRAYPMDKVGVEPILQTAFELRQARLVATMNGNDPDAAAEERESWASSKLREATQTGLASTGKLLSAYRQSLAQSDTAASLSRASTNWTAAAMTSWASASKAAADATANVHVPAVPAADWKSLGAAAGAAASRLISRQQPEDDGSVSGDSDIDDDRFDKYDRFTSPPATPRSRREVSVPARFVSPKNTVKSAKGEVPASIAARRNRSDSTASHQSSASHLSVTSLSDRFSNLAAGLIGANGPINPPIPSTGPRPLLLSGSARRASSSSNPPSRTRGSSPVSPAASLTSPPPREREDALASTPGLYRIGSRSSAGTAPTPFTPASRRPAGDDYRRPSLGDAGVSAGRRLADATASPVADMRAVERRGSAASIDISKLDRHGPQVPAHQDTAASESDVLSGDSGATGLTRGRVIRKKAGKRPAGLKITGLSNFSGPDSSPVSFATFPPDPPAVTPDPPAPPELISIPTPQISHLTEDDYEHVYEPAEDSFILLDALEADAAVLRDLKPALCVEIGSGSGIASTFLTSVLGKTDAYVLSTDINAYAAAATLRTGIANEVQLNPVLCNLLDPLASRLRDEVDVMVFNPPYVETEETEMTITQNSRGIGGAWAGGEAGMMVTNLVLEQVPGLLAPGGRFYLVAVQQNRPDDIIARMTEAGLECKTVLKRRAGREHLSVIRMVKPTAVARRVRGPRVRPNGLNLALRADGLSIPSPSLEDEARTPTAASMPRVSEATPRQGGRSPVRTPRKTRDDADMADDEDEGAAL
ncbi:S-adenosylmethionine-dependent methyltransferase [Cryptotrichosporon argae]